MSEPIAAGVGVKYIVINYIFPLLLWTAGATAYVLEQIRINGWKGWVSALSSGFVAFFAGSIVFTFALIFYPQYAGGLAGLGGFFGPKSITVLIKVLKTTIKEI